MTKQASIYFTVRGKWPFPTDMLRHDNAVAATLSDEALIQLLSQPHAPQTSGKLRPYAIKLRLKPGNERYGVNVERWKSFGWTVDVTEEVPVSLNSTLAETTPPVKSPSRLERRLREAVRAHVDAVTAFETFEREHPNDSTRRWEAVFNAKCDTYERLKLAIEAVEALVNA